MSFFWNGDASQRGGEASGVISVVKKKESYRESGCCGGSELHIWDGEKKRKREEKWGFAEEKTQTLGQVDESFPGIPESEFEEQLFSFFPTFGSDLI